MITMCWKYCVPIAAVCFVGALAWRTFDWPTPNTIPRLEVREQWAVAPLDETVSGLNLTKPNGTVAPGELCPQR